MVARRAREPAASAPVRRGAAPRRDRRDRRGVRQRAGGVIVLAVADPARRPPSMTSGGRDASWRPNVRGIAGRAGVTARTARRYVAGGLGGMLGPGAVLDGEPVWRDERGRLTVRLTASARSLLARHEPLRGEPFAPSARYSKCSVWIAAGLAADAVAERPALREWGCTDAMTLAARLAVGGPHRFCADTHDRLAEIAGIDRAEVSRSMAKMERAGVVAQHERRYRTPPGSAPGGIEAHSLGSTLTGQLAPAMPPELLAQPVAEPRPLRPAADRMGRAVGALHRLACCRYPLGVAGSLRWLHHDGRGCASLAEAQKHT